MPVKRNWSVKDVASWPLEVCQMVRWSRTDPRWIPPPGMTSRDGPPVFTMLPEGQAPAGPGWRQRERYRAVLLTGPDGTTLTVAAADWFHGKPHRLLLTRSLLLWSERKPWFGMPMTAKAHEALTARVKALIAHANEE